MFPGKFMYAGVGVMAAITLFWFFSAGHSLSYFLLFKQVSVSVLFFATAKITAAILFSKRDGKFVHQSPFIDKNRDKIVIFLEGMFFISISWIILRIFNHLTMTAGFAYADDFLIKMDQVIGLDWQTYFTFVAGQPLLVFVFDHAYTGLTSLSMVAFIGLIFVNRIKQAEFFFVAFSITAIFCTVVGMFFPAKAAVNQLLLDTDLMLNFPYPPGVYSVEIIDRLRSEGPHFFDLAHLPGLTTFPSFHTAAGIILVYSYRGSALLYPISLYTAVMIASTPVYGGHYFIDIIAGTIVALVICRYVENSPSFKGIFKPAATNEPIGSYELR